MTRKIAVRVWIDEEEEDDFLAYLENYPSEVEIDLVEQEDCFDDDEEAD